MSAASLGVQTGEVTDPAPPRNFTVTAINNTFVEFAWQPAVDLGGGVLCHDLIDLVTHDGHDLAGEARHERRWKVVWRIACPVHLRVARGDLAIDIEELPPLGAQVRAVGHGRGVGRVGDGVWDATVVHDPPGREDKRRSAEDCAPHGRQETLSPRCQHCRLLLLLY